MIRYSKLTPLALAFYGVTAGAAPAKSDDLAALKAELRQIRQDYQARITALEARLAQAENKTAQAEQTASRAQSDAQAANEALAKAPLAPEPAAGVQTAENAFNPAISVVLAGSYTRLSQDPGQYRIAGFVPSLGEVAPGPRSFGLGESEITLAANVDHLFRGQLTAAIAPEGGTVDVEEGFIQTLALNHGFKLKAGRFFSGIGYMNEQHAHVWDFADAPLVYKAFFGNQLKNDGVQVKWLAPTENVLLELGLEAGSGSAFPATNNNQNGANLWAGYGHFGGDWGESSSWRAGLSYLDASPKARQFADLDGSTWSFSGKSRTLAADFVWKWTPPGNGARTSFKLQGEYFRRKETGDLSSIASAAYASNQSGAYVQGVYQFHPQWRVGARWDRLAYGSVDYAAPLPAVLAPFDPKRVSLMLDWNPSEFSRIRLQVAREQSRLDANDNQIWLQYLMSLGSHGAHQY